MPKPAVALEDWIPIEAAAKLLGVSPRQVQRRESEGYIEKRTAPRLPTESKGRALYRREDVLALKAGTPNVHAREVGLNDASQPVSTHIDPSQPNGAGKALARTAPYASRDYVAAFDAMLGSLRAAPPAPRPWLTLAEAVEYSGLPAAYLVNAARTGTFRAINVGTGAKEYWRFNREGLAK